MALDGENKIRRAVQAAVATAGLVLAQPADAQEQYVQHDYTYERYSARESIRERIRRLSARPTHQRAELPKGFLESMDLGRSWGALYSPLVKGIGNRYEMGGAQVGSVDLNRGISKLGNQRRRDSFVVDDTLLQPLMDALRRMQEEFQSRLPTEASFDLCIVHTHPRTLPGMPLLNISSLPPSANDLKDVLDPGLFDELSQYVGRKVMYREAIVDAKGMWIFSRIDGVPEIDLDLQSSRQIYDAQIRWAQFVGANGSRAFSALIASPEFTSIRELYKKFGVSLEYVSHEDAQHMPLCRRSHAHR